VRLKKRRAEGAASEAHSVAAPVKIEGSEKLPAPRSAVWRALMDPAVLKRCIPGCEKLEPAGDNHYNAVFKAGIGGIKGTFTGNVSISDIVPEKEYTLSSRAKAGVGFVEGRGRLQLQDAGEGTQTVVQYSGDVKLGGMLASVAGRLFDAAARKNISDMFQNLAREFRQSK